MRAAGRRQFLAGAAAAVTACGRERRAASATGPAQRIASQTIPSDEILWALGEEVRPRVIAVSTLVDDARYSTIVGAWPPEVLRAPVTSEEILALQPDLAIVADFTAAETLALVEHAGVGLLRLSGFDGFDDHRRHVGEVAAATGAQAAGARLVQRFDARLEALRAAPGGPRPTILSLNEGNVAGAGTTFADICDAAGFDNAAARAGIEGHQRVSLEQIVAWDPEVLVVPCGPDDAEAVVAQASARAGMAATRAVRSGAVVPVPSPLLYSAGAAMLDVVERLRARHPEAR